jgi:hypothetical protein
MRKKYFFIEMILLSAMVFIFSCKSDDKKAPVENPADSVANSDTASLKKNAAVAAPAVEKAVSNLKDSIAATSTKTKTAEKKIKENKAARHDSAAVKNINTTVPKKDNPATAATDQSAAKQATPDEGPAVFKSKYGTIPRDANQTNLTTFFNTFPDKNTRIRVNFDGPADAEMNSVKTLIIKVLKKSGYTNVEDQSATIEPQRMPKEIHYELQRDGSVVFWVPIANQDQ